MCVFFSMTSAFKVRLGAQLGSTDLSSQLNAGKDHSNGIGFHVIVNLMNANGTAITFEDCGVDCSNTTSNYVIFRSADVTTETNASFDFDPITISGLAQNIHLYEIKYKSGHAHHHIRAIITPPGCSTPACKFIEESILCDLGTVPTVGQCTTCATGHYQNGIACAACAGGRTAAPKAISCDVKSNTKRTFDTLSDTIQDEVQQLVRTMTVINTVTEAENALRDMLDIVKRENTAQRRIFVMGNVMSSIFKNLPSGVRPNDIQMDVTLTDAQLPTTVSTFVQQDFPQYTSQKVRWVGAKTGNHDTCDLDIRKYMGVMEVLIDVDVNPYAVLCRGSTKIVKVYMKAYNGSTGIETVETRCWNGAAWDSPTTRQTGDIYSCNNEYLFVGSAGAINNGTLCPITDASAPNSLVGCDCGTEQCFGNTLTGNGPYCDLNVNDCKWTCIAEYQQMQTSKGHVAVNQLKVGDKIKIPNGKYTVVREIIKEAAPRNILHEVECDGATAHLTDNHAYRCNDKWHHPKNRGRRLADSDETVDVYSIKTENHCRDRLLTSSGLEIEPWDGRDADAMRPHSYVEGRRINCRSFTDQDRQQSIIMNTWSNNM